MYIYLFTILFRPISIYKLNRLARPVYDVIVVGAGVQGLATAWQLAKQNYKTLLLEQVLTVHMILVYNHGCTITGLRIFFVLFL